MSLSLSLSLSLPQLASQSQQTEEDAETSRLKALEASEHAREVDQMEHEQAMAALEEASAAQQSMVEER